MDLRESLTLRRVATLLAGLLLLGASVGVVYFAVPLAATDDSLARVAAMDGVTVERTAGGYTVRDTDPEIERVGLVFYPGGRVAPDAYQYHLAALVREADVTVFVVEMPLNLAVLDSDAADGVRAAHPEIETWYVGGHSLGGAMACRYADGGDVSGVVLLAAYCDVDVRDDGVRVLTVTGSRDGVLNRAALADSHALVPADARFVSIDGMTHAQFGSYGTQRGDGTPTISDEQAHERLVAVLVEFFEG